MNIELTHDILAKKVGQKVSAEDRQVRKIERFVRENYEEYLERGKKAFLSGNDLEYIKPFLDKISFSEEENLFIKESAKNFSKKNLRNKFIMGVIAVVVIVLSGLGIYSFSESWIINQEIGKENQAIKTTNTEIEKIEKEIKKSEEKETQKNAEIEENEKKLTVEEKNKEKSEKEMENQKKEIAELEKKKKEFEITKKENERDLQEAQEILKSTNIEKKKEFFYKQAAKPSRWGGYEGKMGWGSAMKKCEEKGMRLPTRMEYKGAYDFNKDLINKWKNESYGWQWYWTSEEFSSESAYYFVIDGGLDYDGLKDGDSSVRCIR